MKEELRYRNSKIGKSLVDPKKAFDKKLIPVSILLDETGEVVDKADKLGPIWNWCHKIYDDSVASDILLKNIRDNLQSPFLEGGKQRLFLLPSDTKEQWIPDVDEWLLKVACLKARGVTRNKSIERGLSPKESNYEIALENIFAEA